MTTRQGAAVQLVEHLPIEVLAKLLAEAASGDTPPRYMPDLVSPHFLTGRVGQLMLVCKRFAEAVQTAAFWQQSWVALETTTSLYDPRHAAWLRRLAVNVTTPDGGWAGRQTSPLPLTLLPLCCCLPACLSCLSAWDCLTSKASKAQGLVTRLSRLQGLLILVAVCCHMPQIRAHPAAGQRLCSHVHASPSAETCGDSGCAWIPAGGANHGDTESWGPAPGLTHCYQPMLSGLKQLQVGD